MAYNQNIRTRILWDTVNSRVKALPRFLFFIQLGALLTTLYRSCLALLAAGTGPLVTPLPFRNRGCVCFWLPQKLLWISVFQKESVEPGYVFSLWTAVKQILRFLASLSLAGSIRVIDGRTQNNRV
jgi:hypothetical protein